MLYPYTSAHDQALTLAVLLGQKLISSLPWYEPINDSVKRLFPPVLDEGHVVRGHTFLVQSLRRQGIPPPKRVFEQGTGWHGSDVLAFYLLGAERIFTTDTSRWLRKDNLDRTARRVIHNRSALRPVYEEYLKDKVSVFDTRTDLLQERGGDTSELFGEGIITYAVDKDLSLNPADLDSFDLIFSNSVLQRLPVPELRLFLNAKRSARAAHFHRIDCADFHAMRNKKIHKLSYLLADENSWTRWSSKYLNYQNRLRVFEFLTIFNALGYRTTAVDDEPSADSLAFVERHSNEFGLKYGNRDARDIAVTNFSLIARL